MSHIESMAEPTFETKVSAVTALVLNDFLHPVSFITQWSVSGW